MAEPALYLVLGLAAVAVYAPLARGLIAEHYRLSPVPTARHERTADATRSRDRAAPNALAVGMGSADRQALPSDARRVMPAAGTHWRVPVPAAGPYVHHGRPVCG